MILCDFCGYQNRNESKFCTSCGNRLADASFVVGRIQLLGGNDEHREYLISGGERYLGRDVANDIVIADTEASARHALISFSDDAFWIEDLDTTNGTFVNGERIRQRTQLHNEDLIKMGRTLLQFRI